MNIHDLPGLLLARYHKSGVPMAVLGWLYALSVGRSYLLTKSELAALSEQESSDPFDAPVQYTNRLAEPTSVVLGDGDSLDKEPLYRGNDGSVHSQYRIVIIGAGPVGMRLAIELKKIHGRSVQVILVDKRDSNTGLPRPFLRKWPINIPVSSLDGPCSVLATHVCAVRSGVEFLPWSLSDLEAHLYRVATQAGCLFIYGQGSPHQILSNMQPTIVFDATGGRWQDRGKFQSELPVTLLDPDMNKIHGFAEYGVNPSRIAERDRHGLSVLKYDSGFGVPALHGVPIATWMLKIRGVSQTAANGLLDVLPSINHDNKIFVWQTHLKSGEYLLLVSLTQDEKLALKNRVYAPATLCEAREWLSNLPDPRWEKIISCLALGEHGDFGSCWIEPPFLWKPELFLGTQDTLKEKCGLKAIPVGDSFFNGHPQVGNGLNVHLQLIKYLL